MTSSASTAGVALLGPALGDLDAAAGRPGLAGSGDRLTSGGRGFAHVGLTVDDLELAIEWYRDVLGLELLSEPQELSSEDHRIGDQVLDVFGRPVSFRQAHMLLGDGVGLELFEFSDPAPESSEGFTYWRAGISHICIYDREVDKIVERVRSSRGRVRSEKIWEVVPGEPYLMCFCEDPSGNIVELYSHSHEEVFAGRSGYGSRPGRRR